MKARYRGSEMIKKIFITHVSLLIINVLGIVSVIFSLVWEIANTNFLIKLGISFLLGVFLCLGFTLVMLRKYINEDLI